MWPHKDAEEHKKMTIDRSKFQKKVRKWQQHRPEMNFALGINLETLPANFAGSRLTTCQHWMPCYACEYNTGNPNGHTYVSWLQDKRGTKQQFESKSPAMLERSGCQLGN